MSNDALSLSDGLTRPPEEADYDAVYQALTATERGRRFLTEFDSRTRGAETQRLVAALARIEAAIGGSGAPPRAHPDLVEIAAAVDRLKIEIAAAESPAPRGLDAVERLRDIAFLLHQSSIDPKLCAEFDAALREISGFCARSDSAAKRVQKVAEMVDALASRVSEMMALTAAGHREKASSGPEEDPADLFEQKLAVGPDSNTQRTISAPVESETRVGSGRASPTGPSPVANDPLAALRALSQEELIALFS